MIIIFLALGLAMLGGFLLGGRAVLALRLEAIERAVLRLQAADEPAPDKTPRQVTRDELHAMVRAYVETNQCTDAVAMFELALLYALLDIRRPGETANAIAHRQIFTPKGWDR